MSEVGRKRDEFFVEAVRRQGLPETDEQKRSLVLSVWPSMETYKQRSINRKVRQKLAQPDVRQALRDIYQDVGGFSPGEAFSLQIQHMRNGNWAALKHYFDNTVEGQAKKLDITQRSLNLNVNASAAEARGVMRDGPPPTRARSLGKANNVTIEHKGGGNNV